MVRVVAGSFHPYLESALADEVRRLKSSDPLTPLALVVPSQPLAARVRRVLAVDAGLSLLQTHIVTFHQLALRLRDELARRRSAPQPSTVQFMDDLFLEQLVRHIVRSRLSTMAPLQQLGRSSGTWSALWSTVRDLKDAGVDPAAAVRGIEEGHFEDGDEPWLRALFSLHAAMQESAKVLDIGTPDDLAERLVPLLPASEFLSGLHRILYYGFYDLTQVQLSFFQAVIRTVPTTLFFPLGDGNAFAFAARFFDRYVRSLVVVPDTIDRVPVERAGAAASRPPDVHARNVVGAEEELAAVCRDILDLVETHAYRFDGIAVVARTLEPYLPLLQRTFDRYRIPFTTSGGQALIQQPLCKVLLQLAALPLNGFYQAGVLDVLTSPLYRLERTGRPMAHARPDLWKLAVHKLRITRGADDWRRLSDFCEKPLLLNGTEEEGGAASLPGIDGRHMADLWQLVSGLLDDCRALPERASVERLVDAFQALAWGHLSRPGTESAEPDALQPVWGAIDEVLSSLRRLDAIGDELTWEEFVDLLAHAVERMTIPIGDTNHQGVRVMDAMTARGLPAQALFVIGLNEKVFPRYIREDAFLRDRHRRVLDATFGFKIDEKLTGYDEEALLFALLCQAAARRLILSYQRADEDGRALSPSPYLAEALRCYGVDEREIEEVPRRLTDRMARRPAARALLPPADLAVWTALQGASPVSLLAAAGKDGDVCRDGLEALERIEEETHALGGYDGMTGPLEDHWAGLLRRGLAPTPLERYARCPFQYFSSDVLRLESVRRPAEQGLDPQWLGTVCHAALRRCYEKLVELGWPEKPVGDSALSTCVLTAVKQASAACEADRRTGHFLLWEMARDLVAELVEAAVRADEEDYSAERFAPVAFEVEADGVLEGLLPGEPVLKIHGRVDRIDRRDDPPALRVVDYKFKVGGSMKAEDRNLLQSGVRGYRLQPPLYARFEINGRLPSRVDFLFLAPNWEQRIVRSSLSAHGDRSAEPLLRDTLRLLIEGIRAGRFFVLPSESYCELCEFRVACRRHHQPSWWRAHRATPAMDLKAIRKRQVKDA